MSKKRVLVPLDGSVEAEAALPPALLRARELEAQLYLLRVVPTHLPPQLAGGERERERAAWLYMVTVGENLEGQGVDVRYQVRCGTVLPAILEEASDCELLVLATRGAVLLKQVLGETLSDRILSLVPCPVLVVVPERDEVAADEPVRSFEEDASRFGPLVQRSLGPRTVAVDRIVGSVGRAQELRADFLPRYARHGDWRFRQIRAAMERGEILPPVELYKLGYHYYALDGNHRVAAARALGQKEIDALVVEFLAVDDPISQRVFLERRSFEQATGLTRIGAAEPGHYPRLHCLIQAYADSEGIADVKDAAERWYQRTYLPLSERLREARLRSLFPGERTADLFVHLAALRAECEEFLGRPVSWDESLERMLARYRGE